MAVVEVVEDEYATILIDDEVCKNRTAEERDEAMRILAQKLLPYMQAKIKKEKELADTK